MGRPGKQGRPYLANLEPVLAAGIDPKTGLPKKVTDLGDGALKASVKDLIRVIDRQDACNRYKWYNLPSGLTGQDIERWLYYKGQLAFFYMKESDEFYILPYALAGNIDVYGRYTMITPVPLANSKDENGKDKPWIQGLKRKPQYDIVLEPTIDDVYNSCVILRDYQHGISQTITPRSLLHDQIIDVEAECIPFLRTALTNSTGVDGVRVPDEDCQASVQAANDSTRKAALNGQRYIPIVGALEFQSLAAGNTLKTEEFMKSMESLDNFRLSLYGIKNGGLFQKNSHLLQDEADMAGGNVGLIVDDGLEIRQNFCNILNSIWPLGVWCETAETVTGVDKNMDGEVSDEQDGQQPVDMQVGGGEDVSES